MSSGPPPRAPHWIAMEDGWSSNATDCARLALEAICLATRHPANLAFEGLPLIIGEVTCVDGRGQIQGTCAGVLFALDLSARSDGWVEGTLSSNSREAIRFFLERPYEEFEFFPPGHSGIAAPLAAPGRIGKHLTWAQVRGLDWPLLQSTGYLTVEAIEA